MLEQVDFTAEKLSKEDYKPTYKELVKKLVVLQQKARSAGIGLVVLFEGWGGAGKGTRISDLMYELDARATSVHVTPDFDVKAHRKFPGRKWGVTGYHPVMEEFWGALGERGTITFYDRGWYSAAIDQALFEISCKDDKKSSLAADDLGAALEQGAAKARGEFHGDVVASYQRMAYSFESDLVSDGYVVIKFFLHITKEAQLKRMKRLRADSNTAWRVSDEKFEQAKHYKKAAKLYDRLLETTNFDFAPWTLINGEDKLAANIKIASTLVEAIEHALTKQPDASVLEAQAKAAENSAKAMAASGAPAKDESQDLDDAAVLKAAEEQARLQHDQAPTGSNFIIMAGYPQIDHEKPKPIFPEEEYKRALKEEQKRFAALELEMYRKRVPLMLMYEGWDAAGKGGNIKRVAQAIDARAYTVFPSPAPTKPELLHPFLWRYWIRLPKAGHVGIYDRSWYGRVLVERVEGFASPEQWSRAYDEINAFELELVQWGAILLKFWVDITPDEQLRRFKAREEDPSKSWKITDEDWRNRDKYPQYKAAIDDMFRLTSTTFAPWTVLESDDKRYARIQSLRIINEALETRLKKGDR